VSALETASCASQDAAFERAEPAICSVDGAITSEAVPCRRWAVAITPEVEAIAPEEVACAPVELAHRIEAVAIRPEDVEIPPPRDSRSASHSY